MGQGQGQMKPLDISWSKTKTPSISELIDVFSGFFYNVGESYMAVADRYESIIKLEKDHSFVVIMKHYSAVTGSARSILAEIMLHDGFKKMIEYEHDNRSNFHSDYCDVLIELKKRGVL